jgi:hypothetical protein
MALTVSTHLAIPTLIGKGLTEKQARTTLSNAARFGSDSAMVGIRVLPVIYSSGKFTIGGVR